MMNASEAWRRWVLRRRVGRRLTRALPGCPQVAVDPTPSDTGRHGLLLTKRDGRIVMAFDHRHTHRDKWLTRVFCTRPAAVIAVFALTAPEVRRCRAEISDGEESGPNIVSFCAVDRGAILIPDDEFFASRGHERTRQFVSDTPSPWSQRQDTVLWRGTTTGKGRIAADDMSPSNAALNQRTRVCLALRGVAGVDARLSRVAQSADSGWDAARLIEAGILGARLEPAVWIGHKFALDIDGNSNAWSNLFRLLLLGCCVIKVASPGRFRQWYYDDMVAWRHYVPVSADLSDLVERIDWCRSHMAACAEIAASGQALAAAMTFEREMAAATARLNRVLA